jgi:myo-inositol-1(or 4)-monophosphatase
VYKKIISKIVELGDTLPALSGCVDDIGKIKKWLTEKEIEIEAELIKLIKTFPGEHIFYAEESYKKFEHAENVWVIDSISNTKNFIHGMPHYSIVLSHLHQNEVVFCVVYDPSNKELFTAEKGKGTYLNNKKVSVSERSKDTIFMIGPYVVEPYIKKMLKVIEIMSASDSTMRNVGSLGIHYAYVACGRADAAISFNKDTFPEFAGKLLVEEAGGKFTDFKGGTLDNKTEGVIATNGMIHNQIKKIIESV